MRNEFPSEVIEALRVCTLSLFWPKREIIKVFEANNATGSLINELSSMMESGESRKEIVQRALNFLRNDGNQGLGVLRSITKYFLNYRIADKYWFNQGQLDEDAAEHALAHLRQVVKNNDETIEDARILRRQKENIAREKKEKQEKIREKFNDLFSPKCSAQQRGFKLEKLLFDLFSLEDLDPAASFRVEGQQIDGAFKFEGENYIIEAKWFEKSASTEPLFSFAHKVAQKLWGRGVFISINGFSEAPVRSLGTGAAINMVLVDGEDLSMVIEGRITFKEMIDKKVRAAQTKGWIYINPITGKSKI